jgi:Spy/CpxP family protein refolding chaperone
MKQRWITMTLALIVALALSGGQVLARPAGPPAPGDDRPMDQERREELRERIELIWMWRLTEELDLTQEEGAKIFPILRQYEEQKRTLRDENRELVRELDQLIKANASEGKLKKAIGALAENEKKYHQVQEEGFQKLEKILPVEKQARYIVFQEKFRREIHGLLRKAKGRGKGPGRP